MRARARACASLCVCAWVGVCVRSCCMRWILTICICKERVSALGLCGLGALSIHYYYYYYVWAFPEKATSGFNSLTITYYTFSNKTNAYVCAFPEKATSGFNSLTNTYFTFSNKTNAHVWAFPEVDGSVSLLNPALGGEQACKAQVIAWERKRHSRKCTTVNLHTNNSYCWVATTPRQRTASEKRQLPGLILPTERLLKIWDVGYLDRRLLKIREVSYLSRHSQLRDYWKSEL